MKNLLDIQQDVRRLEISVNDVVDRIKAINFDIEDMRNTIQDVDINYEKIEMLAKQLPFGKHPISRIKDERVCQIYLEMLLNIIRLDLNTEANVNRFVFIQWIKEQAGIELSLEELYKNCFKINKDSYYEFIDIIPVKYREAFIVDSLIVASIVGTPNLEVMEFIVNLSVILEISKEKLRNLSLVSRIALSQNVKGISRADIYIADKYIKKYKHYIGVTISKQAIKALRDIVVEVPDGTKRDFRWKAKNLQMVSEGDVIAMYQREKQKRGFSTITKYATEEILATSYGKLFFFKDNCTSYGVIAHETDNKDSIKAWVKSRRKA